MLLVVGVEDGKEDDTDCGSEVVLYSGSQMCFTPCSKPWAARSLSGAHQSVVIVVGCCFLCGFYNLVSFG